LAGRHVDRDGCRYRRRRGPARRAVPDRGASTPNTWTTRRRCVVGYDSRPTQAARLGRERHTEREQMMKSRASAAAIIVLAVVLGGGCGNWRGAGFRASGPEMPRLRHELALKAGMSVADVGAGRGELSVALAAEVGPSGRVFSTDIDTQALEQIRARVAAAALHNVTVVQAHARDTGLPSGCCEAVVLRRVYHRLSDPAA